MTGLKKNAAREQRLKSDLPAVAQGLEHLQLGQVNAVAVASKFSTATRS